MRKAGKRGLTGLLALFLIGGFTSCTSSEDPNLVWLLGLEDGSSTTTTGSGDIAEIPFNYEISNIEQGTGDFVFETNKSLPVQILVEDPAGGVEGTRVLILNGDGQRVLFRAVTDENGNASGAITVNRDEKHAVLEVVYNGERIRIDIDIEKVQEANITLVVRVRAESEIIADADGDGIPDEEDDYPDDPARATMVRVPAEGYYRVAYEDLYPRRGDADFNDYVVQVYHEQDLNANGKLVEMRSFYSHIAKGAGYNHTLHLVLPDGVDGTATLVHRGEDGAELDSSDLTITGGQAIQLMGRSDTTLSSSNTARNQSFSPGQSAELTFLASNPVALQDLGKAPYDLFIKVLNTGHEIHFAGKYYKENGADRYIDDAGFPWALMVPDYWQWPYERENIHDGYPEFDDWYLSAGQTAQNWYDSAVSDYVFPAN